MGIKTTLRHLRNATNSRNYYSQSRLAALLVISVSLGWIKHGVSDFYPASLCNTASYVDIKAKMDTYVGFLPSHALERLLEKSPIVLLTLAKRLLSMLSPLGMLWQSYS